MVTAALVTLLTGIFVFILIPTMKASAQNAARVELQEEALVVLSRLGSDMQLTPVAGLGLLPADATSSECLISLNRVANVTSSSPPVRVYERQLVLYLAREGKVIRRLWPADPSVATEVAGHELGGEWAVRPPIAQLRTFLTERDAAERTLTRNLAEFEVTSAAAAPMVSSPIRVHFVLEKRLRQSEAPMRYGVEQSFALRNGE